MSTPREVLREDEEISRDGVCRVRREGGQLRVCEVG